MSTDPGPAPTPSETDAPPLKERTRYEPAAAEARWTAHWLGEHLFHAEPDPARAPYSIVIPPPNVTGNLHMGHALNGTVQDVLIRYHRMRGMNACWLVGTDHAGIATQNVVEKQSAVPGHQQGRDRPRRVRPPGLGVARGVRRQHHPAAQASGLRLRLRARALHVRRGLRAGRQPRLRLALQQGVHLQGPLPGQLVPALRQRHQRPGSGARDAARQALPHPRTRLEGGGSVTIATTRPETMLGDTAVAVNPADERYTDVVGRTAVLPLARPQAAGHRRRARREGLRHRRPQDHAGARHHRLRHRPRPRPRHGAGHRPGRPHHAGRRSVRRPRGPGRARPRGRRPRAARPAREGRGLPAQRSHLRPLPREHRAAHQPAVVHAHGRAQEAGHGGRPGWPRALRPRSAGAGCTSTGWRTCGPGASAVSSGGATSCRSGTATAASRRSCRRRRPGSARSAAAPLRRETDVLDTWFSSALWPFATWGWPDETPDVAYFYPTAVLSTAREIIFLWVARMIMMGLEFIGDIPFKDVYIHSVVQAPDGRRMSKSLGTGIDPLELIDQYGADATRFGLLLMSSIQDVRFSEEKIQMGRNFANKLWNASRLVLLAAEGAGAERSDAHVVDRWITARLARAVAADAVGAGRLRVLGGRRRPLPLRLGRVLRLVSGDGQGAAVRRRRAGGPRGRRPRALGPRRRHQAAASVPAVRHRRDRRPVRRRAAAGQRVPAGRGAGLRRSRRGRGDRAPGRGRRTAPLPRRPQGGARRDAHGVRGCGRRRVRAPLHVAGRRDPRPGTDRTAHRRRRCCRAGRRRRRHGPGRHVHRGRSPPPTAKPSARALPLSCRRSRAKWSRAEAKLANEQFVGRAPEAVVQKEREKLAAYRSDRDELAARLAELG